MDSLYISGSEQVNWEMWMVGQSIYVSQKLKISQLLNLQNAVKKVAVIKELE